MTSTDFAADAMRPIARELDEASDVSQEFLDNYVASRADLAGETSWRRVMFGRSPEELREYLFSHDDFSLEGAERETGVPAAKIRQAAEMMTGGAGERCCLFSLCVAGRLLHPWLVSLCR